MGLRGVRARAGLLTVMGGVGWRDPHTRHHPAGVSHHPDYAKIARLEVELGLVEAPKPPPSLFSGLLPPHHYRPEPERTGPQIPSAPPGEIPGSLAEYQRKNFPNMPKT